MKDPKLQLELYHAVRSRFVELGSSLNAWCTANEVPLPTAKAALTGYNRSDNAKALRALLLEKTGVKATDE